MNVSSEWIACQKYYTSSKFLSPICFLFPSITLYSSPLRCHKWDTSTEIAANKFIHQAKRQNTNIKEPFLPWYCMLTSIHTTGKKQKQQIKTKKNRGQFCVCCKFIESFWENHLPLIFQDAKKTPPRPADTNVNLYQQVNSILF